MEAYKNYNQQLEARAYLTGYRKAPSLEYLYKAHPLLQSRIKHYRAVLDRQELLNSKHKLEINSKYNLKSINELVNHFTYLARLFRRIDNIEQFIRLAEAKNEHYLEAKEKHALIRYINDNVIDSFLKQTANVLIKKLALKQLKICEI